MSMPALVLGVVAPISLAAWAAVGPGIVWLRVGVLLAYVLLFACSAGARRVGRAGLWCRCSPSSPPVVLGGGWSWVLRRRWLPPNSTVAPPVTCGKWHVPGADWWRAGTSIGELQRTLRREGKSVAGHPSILSATLGGWIASESHGSGGTKWSPAFGRLLVVDVATGERRILNSKRHFVPEKMIVLAVEVRAVENVTCVRRAFDVHTVDDTRRLLRGPNYLRAVFVDKYGALAFEWVADCADVPPRAWSALCVPAPWLAVLLPAWVRASFPREAWTQRTTLSAANAFAPDPPFFLATAAMATHTNFEIFVTEPTTSELLLSLCEAFQRVFADGKARGRVELRFGRSVQFLDVDIGRLDSVRPFFEVVLSVYGPGVRFHLHPGKAQVATAPLVPRA